MKAFKSNNRKGAVLVIVAITLTVLLGLIGLVIDAGIAYGVKAKLNAALDAAGIAGVRASSLGNTETEQRNNAEAAARRFFDANFPNNYLGATATFNGAAVTFNKDGRVIVDVSASVDMPTYVMRAVGLNNLNVNTEAQAVRKDLDMAFVVDNTTSLMQGIDVTAEVRRASKFFIDKFNPSTDRVALVNYAYGAQVPVGITTTRGFRKDQINSAIDNFDFGDPDNGIVNFTNSAEGFWRARDQLDSLFPNHSTLRIIVFFTDGAPNAFASTFVFNGPLGDGNTRQGSVISRVPRAVGLWDHQAINNQLQTYNNLSDFVSTLPAFYDPRNTGDREFPLFPGPGTRPSTNSAVTYNNINRIARNLLEDMAEAAREEGIYVFTLGLGSRLRNVPSGPDGESGEVILKRMANIEDSDTFNHRHPIGEYCYAGFDTEEEAERNLMDCYNSLAGSIMRLSM